MTEQNPNQPREDQVTPRSPEKAAEQIQQQIEAGAELTQAVEQTLRPNPGEVETAGARGQVSAPEAGMTAQGGNQKEDGDLQAFMQLMYEQASELDAVERVKDSMARMAREAGQAGEKQAQGLAEKARNLAMEVSESLFGKENKQKEKQ